MISRKPKSKKQQKERWYFLSFRNPSINKNLECCNVGVIGDLEKALEKTRKLRINPGGEVAAYEIDKPELEPDRLYSRKEMIKLGYGF